MILKLGYAQESVMNKRSNVTNEHNEWTNEQTRSNMSPNFFKVGGTKSISVFW